MTRLFARHTGRRCRHGSLTGWSALANLVPAPRLADDITGPRSAPVGLVPFPMAAHDYTNPLENR